MPSCSPASSRRVRSPATTRSARRPRSSTIRSVNWGFPISAGGISPTSGPRASTPMAWAEEKRIEPGGRRDRPRRSRLRASSPRASRADRRPTIWSSCPSHPAAAAATALRRGRRRRSARPAARYRSRPGASGWSAKPAAPAPTASATPDRRRLDWREGCSDRGRYDPAGQEARAEMKPFALVATLALVFGASHAGAQNAGQIGHARDCASARLRQADLSASIMNHTNFAGGDLRDVNAYGAVFSSANFAGANLTNASFVGTYLQGANFRGARLTGANFSGAEMDHAVGLTNAQLSQACGDQATTLPPGLRLRSCQ